MITEESLHSRSPVPSRLSRRTFSHVLEHWARAPWGTCEPECIGRGQGRLADPEPLESQPRSRDLPGEATLLTQLIAFLMSAPREQNRTGWSTPAPVLTPSVPRTLRGHSDSLREQDLGAGGTNLGPLGSHSGPCKFPLVLKPQ